MRIDATRLKEKAKKKIQALQFGIEPNVNGEIYVSQCNRRIRNQMEPYYDLIQWIDEEERRQSNEDADTYWRDG